MRLISRRVGLMRLMRAAREGQVAVVLFDQTTQTGAPGSFFGRPCAVTLLPGLIARRFGCAARICWTERTGFWRSRVRTEALHATDAEGLTVEAHAWLEGRLRSGDEACADWLWAHDRWKHAAAAPVSGPAA